MLRAMFTWQDLPLAYALSLLFNPWDLGVLMAATVVFALPAEYSGYRGLIASARPRPTFAAVLLVVVVLPICALLIVSSPAAPFIYFRF